MCLGSGRRAFTAFERYDLAPDGPRPTYDELARELGLAQHADQ
jgi:hypothetical protein